MTVAINNETGEVLLQQGDSWVKPQVARNEAGERVYFDGSNWQPFPNPNPTVGGVLDRYKKVGQGFVQGLRDIEGGSTQLMGRILQSIAPSGSKAESFIQGENAKNEGTRKGFENEYAKARGPSAGPDIPRFAGESVAGLPFAAGLPATIPGAVATGAITNSMLPVDKTDDFLKQKMVQTGTGAVGGLAGGFGAKVLGKVLAGATSPEVQTLMKAGVRPTPGQIMGGSAQRIEEGLTSVPLVGDAIRSGQRRAIKDFNRAAINKTLEPIGEKLDGKTLIGRDAVAEAGEKISKAYDALLPKMTGVADQQFGTEMTNLWNLSKNMPPDRAAQFQKIVQDKVMARFNQKTGAITGESLKEAESDLGRLAAIYGKSLDGDQRLLADAIKETQATLRRMVQRSNPTYADRLGKINGAYAQLLRVENAAGRAGSQDGVFSPSALTAATKQMDTSLRKRAFARGNALGQDFAEAGKSVMGSKVPDSGTPLRALTAAGVLGGGGMYLNPYLGATALAGMSAYTPLGQRFVANALATRPEILRFLGRRVGALAPAAGAALAPYGAALAPNGLGLLGQ